MYDDEPDDDTCSECGCTVRSMEELAIENAYLVKIEEMFDRAVKKADAEANENPDAVEDAASDFRADFFVVREVRNALLKVMREEAE